MITIGRMPRKAQGISRKVSRHFGVRAFSHFCGLVVAMMVGTSSTVERLAKLLRDSTHRTKHGEFLARSKWNESAVLREITLDTLRRLYRKDGGKCYLIIDETQVLKRAKKMAGVRKLYHHASGTYGTGHTMVKGSLYYRGVTIPWAVAVCLKEEDAKKEGEPFLTQTQLAAYVIHNAELPKGMTVTVLFDSYYLCPVVVEACLTRLAINNPSWRRSGQDEQGHRKNAKVLRLPPISQLKARMRQAVWQEAIDDVIKHSHEKPVLRRLQKLPELAA